MITQEVARNLFFKQGQDIQQIAVSYDVTTRTVSALLGEKPLRTRLAIRERLATHLILEKKGFTDIEQVVEFSGLNFGQVRTLVSQNGFKLKGRPSIPIRKAKLTLQKAGILKGYGYAWDEGHFLVGDRQDQVLVVNASRLSGTKLTWNISKVSKRTKIEFYFLVASGQAGFWFLPKSSFNFRSHIISFSYTSKLGQSLNRFYQKIPQI